MRGRAVGIQDYAVAGIQGDTVAEAPTAVARMLLYVVRASLSFLLLHQADGKEESEEGEGE